MYRFGQYQMLYPQPINIPNLLFINDLNKKKEDGKVDDKEDSMISSLKDFIKINYAINLRRIIFMDQQRDQQRYYEAQMRYYKKKGRNKVRINTYPIQYDSIPRLIESPYYNFSYY
jgi:hypothetical protein